MGNLRHCCCTTMPNIRLYGRSFNFLSKHFCDTIWHQAVSICEQGRLLLLLTGQWAFLMNSKASCKFIDRSSECECVAQCNISILKGKGIGVGLDCYANKSLVLLFKECLIAKKGKFFLLGCRYIARNKRCTWCSKTNSAVVIAVVTKLG